MTIRIALEIAGKRSFASALDWPGWSRSGRTADDALDALLRYGQRYVPVVKRAGLTLRPPKGIEGLKIVEELAGGSTTEFGVPGAVAQADEQPVEPSELDRLVALLGAAWDAFDDAAAAARGVALSTGPRGGGRTLAKISEHVFDAERSYLTKLGARPPRPSAAAARSLRDAFVATLGARSRGEEPADPSRTRVRWSPRYAVRRAAWHVLDHAWEIEDRAGAGVRGDGHIRS